MYKINLKIIVSLVFMISVMLLTSCSDNNDVKKKEEQQKACDAAFTECNSACTPIVTPDIVTPATCTCPAGSTLVEICGPGAQCLIDDGSGNTVDNTYTPERTTPGGTVIDSECLQKCTDTLNLNIS